MGGERVVVLLLVPLLARLALVWLNSQEWLGRRIEISTPVNQWMRVKEGIALMDMGMSPYAGDIFHETPGVLFLFKFLLYGGEVVVGLFFTLVDFMVAVCVAEIAVLHRKTQLVKQSEEKDGYGKGVKNLLIKSDNFLPVFMAAVYLLSPYSILTCAGYSSVSLNNLAIAWGLWMHLKGNELLSSLGVAVAMYLSLYPLMLIFPFTIMTYKRSSVPGVCRYLVCVCGWVALLLTSSQLAMGSWDFLSAYEVVLSVPDNTPNLGLFWYFFLETFEHFRVFFLCVFQINAFIYVLPLSVNFSEYPMFLTYILLSVTALFKSYPCVGDLTLPLALLPLWGHTFKYLRYTLVVLVMFLVTAVLCPVLYFLWIQGGSANANFFFGSTLAYSLAQIFLLADVMYSFLVHKYDLKNGLPRLTKDGKPMALRLA